MMRNTAVPFLAVLCLCSLLAAQEQPVDVTDIAVDKLLEGVRVTVACSGSPNVSSYVSYDPPAVVVDLMGATSRLKQDRIESSYYPVSAVSVQPSEATEGLRITVRLRDMVDHKVSIENGFVSIDLGLTPVAPAAPAPATDVFAGKRLTLYVKDADLVDILRMIASQFNINILTTQDVKSIITVRPGGRLPAGRPGRAAEGRARNMVETKEGILVVKPVKKDIYGEFVTRIYELDHVEAQDVVKILPKVMSAGGNAELGYRRVSNAGGADRNSIVIVTDIPEAHERVAQFIAELDRPVPQVYIEAKFVETTLSSEDIYGVQWTLSATASSGDFDWGKDFGIPLVFNNMVLGKLDLSKFGATMDILQTRGKSRVLANPSTLTLDDHTATVSMGTDIPQREISTDPKTGLVLYTWRTRSVPISLEVTPHVTSDGRISMKVKPSVEAITGYTGPADDQRPIVARRSAESNIIVGDGEVAVIGGLIRDEETRNVGKVPLLGDIPILGNLFKKTSIRHTKNELVIFIIPHILPAEH